MERAGRRFLRGWLLFLVLLSCPLAWADRSTEQVAPAAGGSYDQIEQLLEA